MLFAGFFDLVLVECLQQIKTKLFNSDVIDTFMYSLYITKFGSTIDVIASKILQPKNICNARKLFLILNERKKNEISNNQRPARHVISKYCLREFELLNHIQG